MGFINSYKHLEKICGEIYGHTDKSGISVYIDEMMNTPNGGFYVHGWNEDLKNLKHYRWIRNQIVHEPTCTEENMCNPHDELWIDNFYSRIITRSDPLSLYNAKRKPLSSKFKQTPTSTNRPSSNYIQNMPAKHSRSSGKNVLWLFLATIVLIIFLIIFFNVPRF